LAQLAHQQTAQKVGLLLGGAAEDDFQDAPAGAHTSGTRGLLEAIDRCIDVTDRERWLGGRGHVDGATD
jgi:hypothetical protein